MFVNRIPAWAFPGLNAGETVAPKIVIFLEVEVMAKGLLLIPKRLIPKDQVWFWIKEWQQKEEEAHKLHLPHISYDYLYYVY